MAKGRVLVALATVVLLAGTSRAALIFDGAGTGGKSGHAEFNVSGTNLIVTLRNTGTNDVMAPGDVLTAIFFDVSGSALSLNRVSGLLEGGSTVFYDADGQPAGGVIGGEWAYKNALAGAPGGRGYGISSAGFDIFGPGDLFPGPDLQPPGSPDGVQYGLLSAADNPATGNGGITGSGGLIRNSVIFTLSNLPAGFDVNRIGNVFFQYGTALSEGGHGGFAPEPTGLAFIGFGGIAMLKRRARR